MRSVILFFALAIGTVSFAQPGSAGSGEDTYLLIGTYTRGKSEGIYVYNFNNNTGAATFVSSIKTDNPSFLAVSPDERYVYAVNENNKKENPGSVAAFAFDKGPGRLMFLNKAGSGGDHPCYVSMDGTGTWVTAANYTGGSVAVLPVKPDGTVAPAVTLRQHTGKGVDLKRQDKPHVHSSIFSPDYRYLLVSDLGIDKVMIYAINNKTGDLTAARKPFFKVKDGEGPRHLSFHPSGKWVYLVTEMGGNIIACKYSNGGLKEIQTISAYPADYKGEKSSADIHVSPDGKFLYASNRAQSNSIAIFSIDPKTGRLNNVGFQSTLGKTPRNFNFDPSGNFLLVANQDSDEVVIFRRDRQTGLLSDTGERIAVGKPVCLKWISHK